MRAGDTASSSLDIGVDRLEAVGPLPVIADICDHRWFLYRGWGTQIRIDRIERVAL